MTLDTIYGSKKAARMTSPACVATTMASVVVVKSPVSSSFYSSLAPTGKLGSSRRRSWPKQSCATARAKAAPWRTLLRATVLTQASMARKWSSSRTPPVHVVDNDESLLSKSGQLLQG